MQKPMLCALIRALWHLLIICAVFNMYFIIKNNVHKKKIKACGGTSKLERLYRFWESSTGKKDLRKQGNLI